jgi:hypothetical protein
MTFVPDILEGSPSLADRTTEPILFWIYLVFMNGGACVGACMHKWMDLLDTTDLTHQPPQPKPSVGARPPPPALGVGRPRRPRLQPRQDRAPAAAGARPGAPFSDLVPARGGCVSLTVCSCLCHM